MRLLDLKLLELRRNDLDVWRLCEDSRGAGGEKEEEEEDEEDEEEDEED